MEGDHRERLFLRVAPFSGLTLDTAQELMPVLKGQEGTQDHIQLKLPAPHTASRMVWWLRVKGLELSRSGLNSSSVACKL